MTEPSQLPFAQPNPPNPGAPEASVAPGASGEPEASVAPGAPAAEQAVVAQGSAAQEPAAAAPDPATIRSHRRRTGIVLSTALAVAVLLCGGGGVTAYFLVQNAQPPGAATPTAAADGFLTAVFADHDAEKVAGFVCAEARDTEEIQQLIDQVTAFESQYRRPRTTWLTPEITTPDSQHDTAIADVTLTLTTADQQISQRAIVLTLVDQRGWWVCDVQAAS